jgi:Ca2+-binding EF-hand superfamily protein
MRKNSLAAIITSTLLAAAASQAQPAPVDQTPQTEAKEMATNTPAADGTPSSSASAASASAEYDQGTSSEKSVTGTEAADGAKAKWTQADTDGSGTLSVSEMQASMPTIASSFSQMDTNADGQVSRDEMHNYKTQHGQREWQKKFSAADTNGDKLLDQTEAQSLPMLSEKFASIDTDKDGKLSAEEMRAHHLAMGEDTREASKTLQHSDAAQEADEKRTTSTSSTTTTTTTDDTAEK